MAEFSIFSPYETAVHSRESDDNDLDDSLDQDEDDGGVVPDSGVSEAGSQTSEEAVSEVSTVSVSEEIKKFQKEINSMAVENSRYFKWKQQRAPTQRSSENIPRGEI